MTMTVTTLRSLQLDSNYKLFWAKVTATAAQLGGHEAQFPHCRKAPKRYEQGGMDSHHFPTTVEEQIYFEALDNICTCITRGFDQPGYHMYHNIQELLLKATRKRNTKLSSLCDKFLWFRSKPSSTHHTSTSILRNLTTVHWEEPCYCRYYQFFKEVITSPGELLSKICTVL